MSNLRKRLLQFLPLVFLGLVVCIHLLSWPETLFETLDEQGWMLAAVGITGYYLIRPFILWPLSLASIFLGYLVGFPSGVPLVLVGTVVTCIPPYVFAEHLQDVNGYVSQLSATGESLFTATGELRGIIAARISPAPADTVSISAGLAGISTWNFVIGTLVGELPWAIFYVTIGQSFRRFSANSIQTVDIEFLLIAAAIAVLLVAGPLYRYILGDV